MGLFFSGSYNQMAQADKDTRVFQMNGNNAVNAEVLNDATSSNRGEGEISGYVDFLVGELETVKKAAVEKIKQKNEELQDKDQLLQNKELELNLKLDEIRQLKEELQRKDNQIQNLTKEKQELERRSSYQNQEMLEKIDFYKKKAMADVQREKDQIRAAKNDLYLYVNKVKEARAKMVVEYKAIGNLLKNLPASYSAVNNDMNGMNSMNMNGMNSMNMNSMNSMNMNRMSASDDIFSNSSSKGLFDFEEEKDNQDNLFEL